MFPQPLYWEGYIPLQDKQLEHQFTELDGDDDITGSLREL